MCICLMSLNKETGSTKPKAYKRIPVRMCVVCRQKSNKRALIRLVKTETGVYPDPSGKRSGRGAYLCDSRSCWERAVSTDMLSKALRTILTQDDRERLLQATP